MKTIAKILLVAVALISTAATVSAQNVKASEYRKEGSVLELKNDRGQVMVAFDIEVGAHFIRPGQLCVITPMFVNGSYQEEFAPVMLEGKRYAYLARERAKFDKIYGPDYSEKIVYYGEPVSVHYQLVTPYTPELKGSTLVLNYKTYDFCGKEIAEQSTTLAHGVNDYADFIQDNPVVYYFPNPVYKTYVNDFNNRSIFRQGHTAIDEDVFRTNGYDDLVAEVKRIDEDKDATIDKVNVETSASPEGALENNECLAEKRSEEIAKQLSKDLDIDKDLITREWIDENWDAFLEELPASGLENVSDIRRIITSNDDLDARENELMMLPNYEEIYQIFQDLRNCQITIDYHTREYFDVETCINGKPYGTVVLGKDQPEISLQKSRQYYDENHSCVTANNMMVALMDAGRYEDALEYAEKISNDDICPVMANNKAVLFMYLDEPYLSASLFSLAKGVPMAKYNEGLMLLKNEEYKRSAELLNDYDESVNSVVANMYVENYDAAAKQSADSNRSASAHYLRAIAYAKDGSEALALGALRQTVSLDPAFKSIALNQAEFIPYRTNAEFIQLTK